MTIRPTLFAGPFLDRRAELRDDPAWVAAARADPATRYLLSAGATQLVTGGAAAEIAFLEGGHPLVAAARDEELTLLGWFRGARCVLVELRDPGASAARRTPSCANCGRLRRCCRPTRRRCWPMRARWRCGSPGIGIAASAARPIFRLAPAMSCAAAREGCGTETFPRLDPAIIVLVTDATGERALLGRQASWAPGRYSTIAGFVEPGESLEDAVIREVEEETGVLAGDVEYVASQPWPFPSSLMLGFRAVARTHDITLRDGELEDARWFTRADLAAGRPALPPAGRDLRAPHRCAGSARPGGPPRRR